MREAVFSLVVVWRALRAQLEAIGLARYDMNSQTNRVAAPLPFELRVEVALGACAAWGEPEVAGKQRAWHGNRTSTYQQD